MCTGSAGLGTAVYLGVEVLAIDTTIRSDGMCRLSVITGHRVGGLYMVVIPVSHYNSCR